MDSDNEFLSLVDSITEENNFNERIDFDVDYECNHEWRTSINGLVCVKCGITKEHNEFIDEGDIVDELEIQSYQFNIKGVNKKMRVFHIWNNSVPYIVKVRKNDIETIYNIASKINISKMIADDAKVIYERFRDIVGYETINKYCTKTTTKEQKIKMMTKHKEDADYINEIKISDCRLRGNSKKGLLCGCLYYACMKNGIYRNCNSFSNAAEIKTSYINIGCNVLMFVRTFNNKMFNLSMPVFVFPYPIDYLKNVCDGYEKILNIIIDENMKEEIKNMMVNSQKNNLIIGHNPFSFSIGIVYLYFLIIKQEMKKKLIECNFNLNKSTVSSYFGISQPTINTTLNELIIKKELLYKQIDVSITIDNERFKKFFIMNDINALSIDLKLIQSFKK